MNDDQELHQWIQELVTRAVQEQIQTMQHYGELLQHVAPDDLRDAAAREQYARAAKEQAAQFARGLATLSLNYYNSLLELARASNEQFIQQVRRTSRGRRDETSHVAYQSVPVELCAPVGQTARAAFVIENKRAQPVRVSFLVSEFSDEGDTVSFRAPLEIEPSRLTLNPREEVVFKLRLALVPELFAAGKRYTAAIAVGGYDGMELVLDVLPEAAKPRRKKTTAAARKTSRTATTRRTTT
jgi:hypothetical protein